MSEILASLFTATALVVIVALLATIVLAGVILWWNRKID
jgi:hypothetical protein